MSEWQPIETAPKDGSVLLVFNGHIGTAYWSAYVRHADGRIVGLEELADQSLYVDKWEWTGEGFEVDPPPTHWMPLPEPPRA